MEDDINVPPPITKNANLGTITTHISYLRRDIKELKDLLEKIEQEQNDGFTEIKNYYVNKDEFKLYQQYGDARQTKIEELDERTSGFPLVQKVVYGFIALVLTAFATALIAGIIPNPFR